MDRPIIHRYWSGPPSDLNDWTERIVRSLHPTAKIHTWGPGDWEVNADQVRKEDKEIHESNVVRFKALYQFGGLWLDSDVIPLCDLFSATGNNWTAGLGNRRETFLLRFEPRHPFIESLLTTIKYLPVSDGRSYDVSGTELINRVKTSVPIETRALPIDASGQWLAKEPPIAIHLWDTGRRRFLSKGGRVYANR